MFNRGALEMIGFIWFIFAACLFRVICRKCLGRDSKNEVLSEGCIQRHFNNLYINRTFFRNINGLKQCLFKY